MKTLMLVLLLLSGSVAWVSWQNWQNQNEAFSFCEAVDIGASEALVDQLASHFNVTEAPPKPYLVEGIKNENGLLDSISLRFFYANAQPRLLFENGCQFEIYNNKVTLRYLTEHNLLEN